METQPPKIRRIWMTIFGFILFFIAFFFYQLWGPNPKIVVSQETTFITEPLAEDGLPDFEAYILQRDQEGVTPENNAAVLLWQALWPYNLKPEHQMLMCDALGIEELPDEGESLVLLSSEDMQSRIRDWLAETIERPKKWARGDWQDQLQFEMTESVIRDATRRPWTSEQIPVLAEWIEKNQKPLDLLVEASQRSEYFSPSPTHLNASRDELIASLIPMTQNLGDASKALAVRAMWHLGEGRPEEAWRDAKANLQLAQFSNQGWCLVQQSVGCALRQEALEQMVAILHAQETTPELAQHILTELKSLPPLPTTAEIIDRGERLSLVECAININFETTNFYPVDLGIASASIDWNIVLEKINNYYDELVESLSLQDRAKRREAIDYKLNELWEMNFDAKNKPWKRILMSRNNRSETVADIILSLLVPALQPAITSLDRSTTHLEMIKLASALAVYRTQHSEYPQQLEDLVPDILEEMPLDLYTNQPFVYERKEDGGYLLYSLYENGVNDQGTDFRGWIFDGEWVDEIPEDFDKESNIGDLVIRVPVPKFKLPNSEAQAEAW